MAASVPFRGSFAWAWPRTKRLAESVWGAIVWLLTAAVAAVIAAFVVPQPTVTIAGQPLVVPDTAVATASRVIVGFVVGAAIALLGMFLLCLFRAPYQQRNELRRLFAESQRALAEADSERARRADPAFQRHLDDQHELARRAMQVLMPERFGQRSIGWGLISVYDEELIPLRGHFPEAAKGIEAWNAAYAAYVGAVTELTGTAQRMAADLNLEDRTDSGFAGLVQLEVKSLNASRVELSETPGGMGSR